MISWMGLLEASVAGGICIVLFYLISRLIGERYQVRYRKAVWLLIALRMCIPVSLTLFPRPFTVEIPVLMLQGSVQQAESGKDSFSGKWFSDAEAEKGFSFAKGAVGLDVPVGGSDGTGISGGGKHTAGAFAPGNNGEYGQTGELRDFANAAGRLRFAVLQDILVILWACGCVVLFGYYLMGHILFCVNMRRHSLECADEEILTAAAEASREMGLKTVPQIRLLEGVQPGPFTVGFFRNTVYLPLSNCQERDLRYIIRHEMAHCAGRDTKVKLFLIFVNTLHWFNPLAWFMKSLVDQELELICDERVLENTTKEERKEYGEVLFACIGMDKGGRSVLSTGYVQGMKFVKKRFRNIFNVRKKSGRAAMCILAVLLMAASGMVGFETGRIVYAGGRNEVAIDSGIELRTDVTGDGIIDRVRVYDDTYRLVTSVVLQAADGREAQLNYEEEMWASSYLVSGDLSGNGVADIVVMRVGNGMHGEGAVSVLHVAEENGVYVWREYPERFLPNADIAGEQPGTFSDIACTGAEIVEREGRCDLRLTVLDPQALAEDGKLSITCSLREDGWYIEEIQSVAEDESGENDTEMREISVVNSVQDSDGNRTPGEDQNSAEGQNPDSGQADRNSRMSGDTEALEEMVTAFYRAYFEGNQEVIRQYLAEDYEWDVEVYDKMPENVSISAIKGLEDVEGRAVGEICTVSVEYLEAGEDSYTYLSMELMKTEAGWEIVFYGLEK